MCSATMEKLILVRAIGSCGCSRCHSMGEFIFSRCSFVLEDCRKRDVSRHGRCSVFGKGVTGATEEGSDFVTGQLTATEGSGCSLRFAAIAGSMRATSTPTP